MPYTEASRQATLRYRRANKERLAESNRIQVREHRLKWKTYTDEVKRLTKIDL
jgi:hypothetical protein